MKLYRKKPVVVLRGHTFRVAHLNESCIVLEPVPLMLPADGGHLVIGHSETGHHHVVAEAAVFGLAGMAPSTSATTATPIASGGRCTTMWTVTTAAAGAGGTGRTEP